MDPIHVYMPVFGMGFILLLMALGTIIIVTLIRTWQTKIAGHNKYQALAEQLASWQQQHSDSLQKTVQELHNLRRRVEAIEKTLREIE